MMRNESDQQEPVTRPPVPASVATRRYTPVEVPAERLGFPVPDARVHVKLLSHHPDHGATVIVWTAERSAAWVHRWLEDHLPEALEVGNTDLESVVRVVCRRPPAIWGRLIDRLPIDGLVVHPDGIARLNLKGGTEVVRSAFEILGIAGETPRTPEDLSRPRPGMRPITARQRDILVVALAEGYYEVPRRISQTKLARLLGMSPAALSESLRRAEGNMVRTYITGDLPRRTT